MIVNVEWKYYHSMGAYFIDVTANSRVSVCIFDRNKVITPHIFIHDTNNRCKEISLKGKGEFFII